MGGELTLQRDEGRRSRSRPDESGDDFYCRSRTAYVGYVCRGKRVKGVECVIEDDLRHDNRNHLLEQVTNHRKYFCLVGRRDNTCIGLRLFFSTRHSVGRMESSTP